MSDWPTLFDSMRGAGDAGGVQAVRVAVAEVRGSAPREAGASMIVGRDVLLGTIGGGNLEYRAVEIARSLLDAPAAAPALRRFPLGPGLGQCCGGAVVLAFEPLGEGAARWLAPLRAAIDAGVPIARVARLDGEGEGGPLLVTAQGVDGTLGGHALDLAASTAARAALDDAGAPAVHTTTLADSHILVEVFRAPDMHVVVFGAGHVGKALVHVLGALPCRVTWIDSRADAFPSDLPANVTANVTAIVDAAPERRVATGPSGAMWVVTTHSHALDFTLCEHVLARADARYCGMIGSATKRRRLERHLGALGFDPGALARLTCPIGVPGIDDKHPGAIAVAVAAQLLQAAGSEQRAGPAHTTTERERST